MSYSFIHGRPLFVSQWLLDHLLAVEERPKRKIGFTVKEKRAVYAGV